MATKAERIAQAISQSKSRYGRLMVGSTHESWLLSKKSLDIYREAESNLSFDEADVIANTWIINEVLKGISKETYSKEEFVAAGGTASEYDDIVKIQQERAEAKKRMEMERQRQREKPVVFVRGNCGRCICRVRGGDVPPGLDPEDVALPCQDDPECPKRRANRKQTKKQRKT